MQLSLSHSYTFTVNTTLELIDFFYALERPDIKNRNCQKADTVNQYICEKLKNQNNTYANKRLNQ